MNTKHESKMKSLDIKIEKTNAIMKYQKLQKLTNLFRFMEMIIFIIMISKFSSQLPFSVKLSGEYFTGITLTILNPKFMFVIGNVIIMILILNSRDHEHDDCAKTDLCYEYVKNYDRDGVSCASVSSVNKRRICRSRSESRMKVKQTHRELRRSVTEVGRCSRGDGDEVAVVEKSPVKEELNGDDFRRTVEAFICRQQKMLRDEEFSPMVCIGGGAS